MGSEWQPCTLDQLIDVKHGWAFKGDYMTENAKSGPVVVAIGNFNYSGGFRFERTKIKRYTHEFPGDYVLKPGDILLAMTCQTAGGEILGIPGIIPDDGTTYLHNQRLGKVTIMNEKKASPDFLYWLFLSKPFNQHLYLTATGTKILHTSPSKIISFQFALPPKDEQEHIAQFLWSLNNKIELNRRINTTLEAMAQALFKSWFVDFDPVIDNALAAGNPIPDELAERAERRKQLQARTAAGNSTHLTPGQPLPAVIQQQFPDRFVFTEEMGWVPEGWEVAFLKDVANIAYGRNLPTSQLSDSGYPVFGGNGVIGYFDRFLYKQPQVLVSCRGAASGRVLRTLPFSYVTNNSLVIEHEAGPAPFEYLYFALLNQDLTTYISGSAQPQMTVANMNPVQILLPSKPMLAEFAERISVLLKKSLENDEQSRTLSTLRDTLLPKLLSGQLRIPEAEQQLAEAI